LDERPVSRNAGEIAFLQSGLARTITFEAVLLTRSDAPGAFPIHRYVGRGENVQEAYNIEAAETKGFFDTDTVVREAHAALGTDAGDVTLGVVKRIAVTAKYDIGSGRLSFTPTFETAPLINEAIIFGNLLNPNVLVPLASVAELELLRLAQSAYENSLADLLSAQEAAELSILTAARERIANNLTTAIQAYDRAVKAAREAAGVAIIGSLLGLAGQIAGSMENDDAALKLNDRLGDVEEKFAAVQNQLNALNREMASVSKKITELGHELPRGYGIINLQFVQQIYVPPVVPKKDVSVGPQP
jgi:hypothetical protein